ncbi:unnamed protein product [Enterobius vermicularis]|uniref:Dipeptidyl peptidase 4 n=1 Tax=Enterobius vermicularis TaxID=51028 RepID=A0A0N4V0N4_ENTVE|nr:unnamed protein product [Enterobius vermicularis]
MRWFAKEDLITSDDYGNILLLKESKGFKNPLILVSQGSFPNNVGFFSDALISADGRYFAVPKNSLSNFRYSNLAVYEIYEYNNGTISSGYKAESAEVSDNYLQLFVWNPLSGSNDYVTVYGNNIYYHPSPENNNITIPVTTTGGPFRYNGVADWLYEGSVQESFPEEIFANSHAIWWSPSGNLIAYASFDDSSVELSQTILFKTKVFLKFCFLLWIPHHTYEHPNPVHDVYPYPTTGTKQNPVVALWVWNKKTKKTESVAKPRELNNQNKNGAYLFSVQWIEQVADNANSAVQHLLLTVWANRPQNETYISLCNPSEDCSESALRVQKVSFDIDGRKLWAEPSDFKDLQIRSYSGGSYDVSEIVGYAKDRDEIYAGPNTASSKAETPWELLTFLANNRQYIIITIDATGSANRGWNVKEEIYKNLGGPEINDQIDILRKLLAKYPFMDKNRVAAFGWSYGGFVTLHIGGRDGGKTVKCVVAVAPVVSFLYYDSAYSERYMGMVEDNMFAYENENNENWFKVYPNEGHSLHNTINHLYHEVDKFLHHDCFGFKGS